MPVDRADAPDAVRAREQAGRRPAARDAARPDPLRRSSSTSTAAPPAWSPSRTSSRRSSARSPTSTTARPPEVEDLGDGRFRVAGHDARRRPRRAVRRRRSTRTRSTPSAGCSARPSAGCRSSVRPCEVHGLHLTAERCRVAATGSRPCSSSGSSRRRQTRRRSDATDRHRMSEHGQRSSRGLRLPRRPAQRRQVDADQRAGRAEGRHHVGQAADHAAHHPRHRAPARTRS